MDITTCTDKNANITSITNGSLYDYNQFEIFYGIIIALMPISKRYSPCIHNDVVRRKINQYTNWNILMILANATLYNVFNLNNHIISHFIAVNSFQIMTLFHLFMIYDSNVLFCVMDAKPFLLKHPLFSRISNHILVRSEYFVANIFVHILPVYFYKDYLTLRSSDEVTATTATTKVAIDMFHYIIMFKFMWVLNIFGDFNITSIYVPTFSGCNVKLINLVVAIDFLIYKLLNSFL
jgi:hypothetical protein